MWLARVLLGEARVQCTERETTIEISNGLIISFQPVFLPALCSAIKRLAIGCMQSPSLVGETLAGRQQVIKVCFVYMRVNLQGGLNG